MMPIRTTTQSKRKSEEKDLDPYKLRQEELVYKFVHEQEEELKTPEIPQVITKLIFQYYIMDKITVNEQHELICICGVTMKNEKVCNNPGKIAFLEFRCHVCRKWEFKTAKKFTKSTYKHRIWHCESITEKSKNIRHAEYS